MPAMTMNRVIHQAVRRDLARTRGALAAMSPGDDARAAELLSAWRHLQDQLHHHHTVEDHLIWPFLRGHGATGPHVDAMEGEHREMAQAIAHASTAMTAMAAGPTRTTIDAAGTAVTRAEEVTCAHLDHEEAEVEPMIVSLESDPGWKTVEQGIRRSSKGRAGQMFAWVQDGAPADTKAWLRTQVPGPVLFLLAQGRGGRRYRREVARVWR